MPLDGMPVIGPAKNCPQIYIASMHSGVTLAPLVGQLVSNELLDDCDEGLLAEFRHQRFN